MRPSEYAAMPAREKLVVQAMVELWEEMEGGEGMKNEACMMKHEK